MTSSFNENEGFISSDKEKNVKMKKTLFFCTYLHLANPTPRNLSLTFSKKRTVLGTGSKTFCNCYLRFKGPYMYKVYRNNRAPLAFHKWIQLQIWSQYRPQENFFPWYKPNPKKKSSTKNDATGREKKIPYGFQSRKSRYLPAYQITSLVFGRNFWYRRSLGL